MNVAFDHISFSYGVVEVLHDVSFDVPEGRILAILGENGAGKSTLMNILGGLVQPARGGLLIDGAPVCFHGPEDSIAHGIAFIHQELSPVNDLRVYENMFLGRELRKGVFLDRDSMRREAADVLRQIGIDIDADAEMRGLDASRKQLVEIARALLCHAKCLIMDEPTTSLAEPEIKRLFDLVRRLAVQGVTILFISHKLREVKELCDAYVVMRNGSLVADGDMAQAGTDELSRLIVGRDMAAEKNGAPFFQPDGRELLRVDGLSHGRDFNGVSFSLRAGEILGFTGLLGDGRSEIFRAISGDIADATGEMILDGDPFHAASTREALAHGIAYLPNNRKENAVLPDLSIADNGTLATLRRYRSNLLLRRSRQREEFARNTRDFRIKYGNADDPITTLSGGNQQKVILSRWLNANPKILILDNPTQGVDVGAKQEIYEIIRKIAADGVGVVVLSGEGQEIVRLCTRAIVLFHGAIAGELAGDALSEQSIMRLATGG